MSNLQAEEYKNFEEIKKIREDGTEYWNARELSEVLQYKKWENFSKVIDRAKLACNNSGFEIQNHFPEVRKMVEIGSNTIRELLDYELSRYACYLIVQNGDPRKEVQAIQSQMLTSEGLIPDEIFNVYTMEVEDVSNRNAYTETMLSMVPSFILMTTTLTAIFSMLVSALAIVVASKAKSFKEAQNSSQPLSFLCLIPMFLSIMGIELNTTLALIPFVNVSLLINQIISNSVNMQYFVIMVISNIVFIFILLKAISKLYKSDKILFS